MKLQHEEEAQAFSPVEQSDDEQREEETNELTKTKKHKKIKATIQLVPEQTDKVAPLIGYFTTGFDPFSYKSKTKKHTVAVDGDGNGNGDDEDESQQKQHTKVTVLRGGTRENRVKLVVAPNGSNVEYVGTSYGGEATYRQQCTYALGVLDKKTQTLKIVPITSNKIFRLEPRVAGVELEENVPDGSKTPLNYEERVMKMRETVNKYGTKKDLTKAKKRDTLNRKEDPNLRDELDNNMKGVTINKESLESATSLAARNIPPYNSEATTPELAFPLDRIILSGDWNYLADVWSIKSEEAPDTYPRFVRSRFRKLTEIEDEEEQRKLAGILSYISHLIKYKDQHSMDGKNASNDSKLPIIFRSRFSTMFTDGGESKKRKRLADDKSALLISYVCVLTLFADQFKSDLADIAKDLRMSNVDVRKHYENLGCKFVREKNVSFATLTVPLTFPGVRLKRKQRK